VWNILPLCPDKGYTLPSLLIIIMKLSLYLGRRYSYADYLSRLDDVRRELIDGVVRLMGAPLRMHQRANMRISARLFNLIESHHEDGEVYAAPFEVRFPVGEPDSEIKTVLQPDIYVLCDKSKLRHRGCHGTPDWVIEILSLSSLRHDVDTKFHSYERHGMREYWVVDPVACGVNVYILGADGRYDEETTYESGVVPVGIFGGAGIELSDIFE
jgi:Uma2 family endonuclease